MSDDMEDYGFEYSDDEYVEEDVDIENQYYNSKGLLESEDLKEALQGFQQVLKMEEDKGEWGFKALKQIVKLHYRLGDYPSMLQTYKEMLAYTKTAVTRNAAEKKINSVLDFVSQCTDPQLLQDFYGLTLEALAESNNERLWFKTSVKLANLWLTLKETEKAVAVLEELRASCRDAAGNDDNRKGTQLLEIYALQIQLHSEQRNARELKALYKKALSIESAIPHPRIMGIIRECGGKMHMYERKWAEAATDFFEAFKSYDEAGSSSRVRCLKYLVLANMLTRSKVDPFDSQEARPYRNDPQVSAMTSLVEAYHSADVKMFERVLRAHKKTITDDPFVSPYIEDLKNLVRTDVVVKMVMPYRSIKLSSVATKLDMDAHGVEQLLIGLILDDKIQGRIDQVHGVLQLESAKEQAGKYAGLSDWAEQVSTLVDVVGMRMNVI